MSEVVAHSRPIDDESHLKGRDEQVKAVTQAILAPGRHVFIYGERGVGKTSLAKTVGLRHADNRDCFKQIGCSRDASFDDLVRLIISMFEPDALKAVEKRTGFAISSWLGVTSEKVKSAAAPGALSVSKAADILASLDDQGPIKKRIVVIDEVDRISSDKVKGDFAELLKLLGDRASKITLIFTGVGSDLDEILGSHASSFRQLAQIKLERIDFDAALRIFDDAMKKFSLDPEIEPTRTARFRIASIANGFPYYVHLLTEKVLYAVYEDHAATSVTQDHLQASITAAVKDAQEEIRKPYDRATRGRDEKYKLAAWASADSWSLERTSEQMHVSYRAICEEVGCTAVDKKKFLQVLASLKRPTYGPLLKAGYRKGQYEFNENIVRGYVRLCAAGEGVDLRDLSPDPAPVITAHGKTKRQIHPSRIGGLPRTFG